jgi:hypothetical protein
MACEWPVSLVPGTPRPGSPNQTHLNMARQRRLQALHGLKSFLNPEQDFQAWGLGECERRDRRGGRLF